MINYCKSKHLRNLRIFFRFISAAFCIRLSEILSHQTVNTCTSIIRLSCTLLMISLFCEICQFLFYFHVLTKYIRYIIFIILEIKSNQGTFVIVPIQLFPRTLERFFNRSGSARAQLQLLSFILASCIRSLTHLK